MKKSEINAMQTNKSLLNIVTPISGLEYKQSSLRIGDNYAKIYTIIKYPKYVTAGWLSRIANIPNTVSVQIFEPTDNLKIISSISKGIRQSEVECETSREPIDRQRALRAIADGQEILDKVDNKGETVGYMTLMLMVVAEDEETLVKRCKRVENKLASMQMKSRSLANLVREAFKTVSPFNAESPIISNIAKRNVLISDFIGGFPFGRWRI